MESLLFFLYNLLLHLLGIAAIPVFLVKISKYKHSLRQKLGFFPSGTFDNCTGSPRIWINAVSVGEVVAVSSIIREVRKLLPDSSVVVSTGTVTGQKMARKLIKDASAWFYFPFDVPVIVKKMIDKVSPDLFITAETEIWPNFLRYARKAGVKTMLVNGRISVRSVSGYYRARFFFRKVLGYFDCLGMASEIDAERIKMIGAPENRVFVTSNSKFDTLAEQVLPVYEEEARRALKIGRQEDVFIAASTHPGEEEIIIESYKKLLVEFPELILVIVPRHVERVRDIEKLLKRSGFDSCYLRTEYFSGKERQKEPVIIMDTTGELFKIYSVGTVVFCGGSLVRKGGQNVLEPAAWGKVVLYGPSMEDFSEAKQLLEEAGAGFTVKNAGEIVSVCRKFLNNPGERGRCGEAGRKAILGKTGAAIKSARLVMKLV